MSFGPALRQFVRDTIGPLFGYGFHPAAVVSQASDGSVEVKPDSPVVSPQKGVPLVLGLPGVKVKVGPGTRVRLSFAGGSPGASEVALWEGDGLLELEIDASSKVVLNAPAVHLGEDSPAYSVALAEKVRDEITALRNTVNALTTAYNAHVHPVSGTVTPALVFTGASTPTASQAVPPSTVQAMGSATVKAKD